MKSRKLNILFLLAIGIGVFASPTFTHPPAKIPAEAKSNSKDQPARFHHVRLNVVDPTASAAYYQKFFSAVPVKFRGASAAVLTDRSYFLFNKATKPAPRNSKTALWHIGWGGIDGPSEHKWRTKQGIKWAVDLTTVGKDQAHFMYADGPDHEEVEIWTGTPYQRYNHVHLLATDINLTRDWYMKHLGAKGDPKHIPNPGPPPADMKFADPPEKTFTAIWNTAVVVDGVIFNIFGKPDRPVFWWPGEPIKEFEKTEGHVINHFAFSYPKIGPVFDRMKADGVEIVKEISWNEKLKMMSFFVRAPDNVLVEIVEADPLPEASWLRHVHDHDHGHEHALPKDK